MLTEILAPTMNWLLLSPLVILFGAATLEMFIEAFMPRNKRHITQFIITILAILGAMGVLIYNWANESFAIIAMGAISADGPAYCFWTIIFTAGLLGTLLFGERRAYGGYSAFVSSASTVPGTFLEREADQQHVEHTEVYPLLLFSLFGMGIFASASDTITLFVGLEILSLPLYLLSGLARRRRLLSQESAMKYFLLGALSSGFFLYGLALLYGYAGSFRLRDIDAAISMSAQSEVLLLTGMCLISAGILFKIGAVPFHTWTPDVYTGAPTPVTGFMAVATKTAAVACLLRIYYVALGGVRWDWQPVLAVIAIITMLVGAVIGIAQTDIKRLLAYSSIAHAGFILVGLLGAVTTLHFVGAELTSVSAIAFYLVAYALGTLGAFAMVTLVRVSGGEATSLKQWAGIGRENPLFGSIMALFMFSFAGIPLTAGFVGKFAVFVSAWRGGYPWLVFVAIIMSLVAAYFYLRVIVIMFFTPTNKETATVVSGSALTWIVILLGAVGSLLLGILPGQLLEVLTNASMFLR